MFSKNVISNVDPYAISEMEFNIKKSNRYTTIKSLIGTLAIFVLTILISLDSIQNLWRDRKELPISRLDQLKDPLDEFTDSPICFENPDPTSTVTPNVLATNSNNQSMIEIQRD